MASKDVEVTRKWDTFVREAARPDYVLDLGDGELLHITNPTGTRLLRIGQALRAGDEYAMLVGLTGEAFERINKLLETAGHKVITQLAEDLMDHFDIYEDVEMVGPGGGKVTEKRPSKIKQLVRMGYKPLGE